MISDNEESIEHNLSNKYSSPGQLHLSMHWILQPIHRAIVFVGEEAKIGGLLQRALTHLELGRPLLELAAQQMGIHGMGDGVKHIEHLLLDGDLQGKWAAELREIDYTTLNAHSLVSIWGALETCVQDVVVAVLQNDLSVLPRIQAKGGRVGTASLSSPPTIYELRSFYKRMEDVVRVDHDVIQTQERTLNLVGLSADCPEHKESLLEANSLRNAIVHCGGVIDEKAVKQAPTLAPLLGTQRQIAKADFVRYHLAVSGVLVALLGSAAASEYAIDE